MIAWCTLYRCATTTDQPSKSFQTKTPLSKKTLIQVSHLTSANTRNTSSYSSSTRKFKSPISKGSTSDFTSPLSSEPTALNLNVICSRLIKAPSMAALTFFSLTVNVFNYPQTPYHAALKEGSLSLSS